MSLKSRHLSDFPKHVPQKERNFRRKRKQLPELQGMRKHERSYTSALLKAAKCRERSLSWGWLLPHHSLRLIPSPCSWHPQIPGSPFRGYRSCHRGPTSLADLGHETSLQPQN